MLTPKHDAACDREQSDRHCAIEGCGSESVGNGGGTGITKRAAVDRVDFRPLQRHLCVTVNELVGVVIDRGVGEGGLDKSASR